MSSPITSSPTAQQKVLEVDMHLLGAVLAFLGSDARDCFAATFVNRFWHMALERCVSVF